MADRPTPRVCILTTAHDADDDRIFHKQALTLAHAGYDVSMVAAWEPGMDSGPVHAVPLSLPQGKLVRVLWGGWQAFRVGLKAKGDVYHFHDPDLLPVGVALKLVGRRVVYDAHEDYSLKIRSRALPWPLAWLASRLVRTFEAGCAMFFDRIITADSHVAGLFPAAKTTVIANYPPLRFVRIDTPRPSRAAGAPLRIAYVGGISRPRGIPQVLAALDLLEPGTVEFHVAGGCSDPDLLAALQRHPRVIYHGLLPWEQVSDVLFQADVGMLTLLPIPAYVYCPGENIIKLWEYLGLGLPVIVSHFPRLKALVEQLDVGLAVDPEDAASIAAAIRRLRDEPAELARLGANGRRVVRESRHWEAEGAKLVRLYQELVPLPATR